MVPFSIFSCKFKRLSFSELFKPLFSSESLSYVIKHNSGIPRGSSCDPCEGHEFQKLVRNRFDSVSILSFYIYTVDTWCAEVALHSVMFCVVLQKFRGWFIDLDGCVSRGRRWRLHLSKWCGGFWCICIVHLCTVTCTLVFVSFNPKLLSYSYSFLWRASKEASRQAKKQERKQARRHARKQSRNQAKKQARRKESRTRKQANNTCTDLSPKQAICILKSFPYNFKVFQSNKVISVALLVAPRTHGWLPHSKVFETHVGHVLE